MGTQDSDVNEKYALIVALREKFEMCYDWNEFIGRSFSVSGTFTFRLWKIIRKD